MTYQSSKGDEFEFNEDDLEANDDIYHVPFSFLVYPFAEQELELDVAEPDAVQLLEDVGRLLTTVSLLMRQEETPIRQARSMPKRVDGDKLPVGPQIDKKPIPKNARLVNYEAGYVDPTSATIYGATFTFFFHDKSNTCPNGYSIIQISKVKAERKKPDGTWEDAGSSHDWDVDGERGTTNPTSKGNKKAAKNVPNWPPTLPDAKVFSDTPGAPKDPWTNADAVGKTFRWTFDFETYIICKDPPAVLGYYTWGFTMEISVGTNKKTTSAKISNEPNRNKANWKNGAAGGHLREGLGVWNQQVGPSVANALSLPQSSGSGGGGN